MLDFWWLTTSTSLAVKWYKCGIKWNDNNKSFICISFWTQKHLKLKAIGLRSRWEWHVCQIFGWTCVEKQTRYIQWSKFLGVRLRLFRRSNGLVIRCKKRKRIPCWEGLFRDQLNARPNSGFIFHPAWLNICIIWKEPSSFYFLNLYFT